MLKDMYDALWVMDISNIWRVLGPHIKKLSTEEPTLSNHSYRRASEYCSNVLRWIISEELERGWLVTVSNHDPKNEMYSKAYSILSSVSDINLSVLVGTYIHVPEYGREVMIDIDHRQAEIMIWYKRGMRDG